MLTLLALGLMLLAFFAVLNSTASFDQRRTRDVVDSLQTTFMRAQAVVVDDAATVSVDATHRAAVDALRASVADMFAGILAGDQSVLTGPLENLNTDRVEVDVPASAFFDGAGNLRDPLPILDSIVAVAGTAPTGYRMEMAVRAADGVTDRLAIFADNLVHRGFSPTALSVGALSGNQTATGVAKLRFTFMLLDTGDDLGAVRMLAAPGKGAP
jgi:hypothetical protein